MTINFVAIAKRDKKGIRIKSCYSEKPEFRDNFERVTIESLLGVTTDENYRIEKKLQSGEWLYVKSIESGVYVVITSEDYPCWLAVECIDELSLYQSSITSFGVVKNNMLYSKETRGKERLHLCVAILAKYSKDEPGCVLYDLRMENDMEGNMDYLQEKSQYMDAIERYLEERDRQERERKWKEQVDEINEQVDKLKNQMADTLMNAQENISSAENLKRLADHNLEQAKIFRQRAEELRKRAKESRFRSHIATATTVTAAAAGAILGLELGAEGIEAAVAAAVAGAMGYGVSGGVASSFFWAQKRLII